jgi:thioredoxin-like negative regulator of GroEL
MALFRRSRSYDRARILGEAARARSRGRTRKAIALYRQVLEVEPANHEVHRKLAPLLARTKQSAAAKDSYLRAAEGLARQGFQEQATGVYREAVQQLPPDADLYLKLADLQLARGRAPDALEVLLEGRRRFRRGRGRREAIRLLMRARRIDGRHFEVGLDLASLLAKEGARAHAQRLLVELASFARGPRLRRVRARQFRLAPAPGAAWLWLRALVAQR